MMGAMDAAFGVLGPLTVTIGGHPVSIRSGRQRALLVALVLRPGRSVTATALIDAVWGDRPPATARNTLQVYLMRLRQTLAPADIVTTDASGYRMDVPVEATDAGRFAALLTDARTAASAGDLATEFAVLTEALALWRGPALADIDAEALHRDYGAALEEQRLSTVERRFDVGLALGRHTELVAELAAATAENPLRERFWCQRMLALYRSGRQADALEAYQEINRLLADELGIDPGEELRGVHQAILRGEATAQAERPAVVPAQLPPDPTAFCGRTEQLAALDRLLTTDAGVAVVSGIGGVGKSALAVHWGWLAADRFPDGQLYVDLRGYDEDQEPIAAEHALDGFLRALGVTADQMPTDAGERAALYRSLLADRRVLVLLDNARSSAQVRPLLPAAAGSRVLITSRDRLDGLVALDGAGLVDLDVLDTATAIELLARLVPAQRSSSADAARRLADRCDGLPLALRIAAARVATNPHQTTATLADALADESDRLTALSLEGGAASVRATLDLSYRALPDTEARLLRLIAIQPARDITAAAAAAVIDLPSAEVSRHLDALCQAHLLFVRGANRFAMHDLIRAYARERSAAEDSPDDVDTGLRRGVDWLLVGATAGNRLIGPSGMQRPPELLFAPADPPSLRDFDEAVEWQHAELDTTVAAIEFCEKRGWHRACWQLASKVMAYLDGQMLWDEHDECCRAGLRAARVDGDEPGECLMLCFAARGAWNRDNYGAAIEQFEAARLKAIGLDDHRTISRIEGSLGALYQKVGEFDRGEELLRRAISSSKAHDDLVAATYHEINLGYLLLNTNLSGAEVLLAELHESVGSLNDPYASLTVQIQLAELARASGRMAEAAEHAVEAVRYARLGRRVLEEAEALVIQGECTIDSDRAQGLNCWRLALDIYESRGNPRAVEVRKQIAAAAP
jgi:DNA-binding SARP family transcriptional activator